MFLTLSVLPRTLWPSLQSLTARRLTNDFYVAGVLEGIIEPESNQRLRYHASTNQGAGNS
jgi:hypothetical protein